jgi:acyl-CoA reductase-like NAD-dependent aldehyde dehydrogenase
MATTTAPAPFLEQTRRARAAQRAWEETPVRRRLRPVRALRHLLVSECDALCSAVARDLGKTAEETIGGELVPTADALLFLECNAKRLLRPRKVGGQPLALWRQRDVVYRRPRGVVGIIGTWNFPLYLNTVQIVQALTAGNAVLWKPSEVAPSAAAALGNLLHQAGFPADLAQKLPATREAGAELAEADVDHVVFTGSAAVGRKLAARLGERLVSSTLELTGCDAQFVLDDADVNLAARAAWFGATVNRGQTCIAVRRSFVARPVYADFCEAFRPLAEASKGQPLALPSNVAQARRLIATAVDDGARLLGEPGTDDNALTPVVLIDARPEMAVCCEASFAPLLAVLPFDTFDEALAMDAICPYRLGASVFTRSPKKAEPIAARLGTGMVTVNDTVLPTTHPATPFGGRGASGWGVTQGAEGLLEMTVPQVVSSRGGTWRPHYDLTTPGAPSQENLVRGLLESAHAPSWWARFRGWRRLMRALWRG